MERQHHFMRSEILIRQATLADVAALAKIHVDTWRSTYRGLIDDAYLAGLNYESREQRWRKWIELDVPGSRRLVAEIGNAIEGFVIVGRKGEDKWQQTSEMYALYVSDPMQGNGIGTVLFAHAANWLKQAGHASMLIRVLVGNTKTVKFYESRGALFVGEDSVELGGTEYPEVIYEFDLSRT